MTTERLVRAVLGPLLRVLDAVLPLARTRRVLVLAVLTAALRIAVRRAATLAVLALTIDLARRDPQGRVPRLPVWDPPPDLDERLGRAIETVLDDLADALADEEAADQFEDRLEVDDLDVEPDLVDELPAVPGPSEADRVMADIGRRQAAERAVADAASAGRARARAEQFEADLARYDAEDAALQAEITTRRRIENLAISELVRAADAARMAALADDPSLVVGWVRVLNDNACELCQAWARDEAVRPAERKFKRHHNCVCSQAWITDMREVAAHGGFANRSESIDERYREFRRAQRARGKQRDAA